MAVSPLLSPSADVFPEAEILVSRFEYSFAFGDSLLTGYEWHRLYSILFRLSVAHTQILELHTTYIPTDYRCLLQFLLQPVIRHQKGNIPCSKSQSMMHKGQGDYARIIFWCEHFILLLTAVGLWLTWSSVDLKPYFCRQTGLAYMFTFLCITCYSLWQWKLTASLSVISLARGEQD